MDYNLYLDGYILNSAYVAQRTKGHEMLTLEKIRKYLNYNAVDHRNWRIIDT